MRRFVTPVTENNSALVPTTTVTERPGNRQGRSNTGVSENVQDRWTGRSGRGDHLRAGDLRRSTRAKSGAAAPVYRQGRPPRCQAAQRRMRAAERVLRRGQVQGSDDNRIANPGTAAPDWREPICLIFDNRSGASPSHHAPIIANPRCRCPPPRSGARPTPRAHHPPC
jgi:hypothetical protein